MKRFLLSLAVGALLLPGITPARGADVSVNFFYDNLNGGNWYQVADYGYVWQPDVASSSSWRPYTDGYWAYTDVGWTWVSYEDFGWATYHYGRWARLADYGWVWVPGNEWGPAWVSWRTGGDYVGWAPLPPSGEEVVYEGRPVTGAVDIEFGIGPAYYNFVDLRYIGEPVLRDRILDYNQNVVYINNTVNVTNITYNNGAIYNYGPDYAFVSAYSTRPIQRLTIQRENIDPLQAVRTGNITKVQGNKLMLAAPLKLQKANAQLAPRQVKAKIDQPKIEKGWSNISDPNAKAQLEQKFKSENRKDIPKPNIQPKNANAAVNAAGPVNPAASAGGASPVEVMGEDKGKGKSGKFQTQARGSVNPSASPEAVEQGKVKKNKGAGERAVGIPSTSAGSVNQDTALSNEENAGKGKKNKGPRERVEAIPSTSAGPVNQDTALSHQENVGKGKNKENKHQENAVPNAPGQSATDTGEGHRDKLKGTTRNAEAINAGPNGMQSQQGGQGRHKGQQRLENANMPPGGGPNGDGGKERGQGPAQQQQPQGQEDQGKGKEKGKKAEPSPSP